MVVRLRHIPATNTQVRTCPTEKSYIRKEERRQEGDHKGVVGALLLSGKFEMNGYLIGVGGFHGENKGSGSAESSHGLKGPFCSSISDGGL